MRGCSPGQWRTLEGKHDESRYIMGWARQPDCCEVQVPRRGKRTHEGCRTYSQPLDIDNVPVTGNRAATNVTFFLGLVVWFRQWQRADEDGKVERHAGVRGLGGRGKEKEQQPPLQFVITFQLLLGSHWVECARTTGTKRESSPVEPLSLASDRGR